MNGMELRKKFDEEWSALTRLAASHPKSTMGIGAVGWLLAAALFFL